MLIKLLILAIFAVIDAVPLNLQTNRASQVVDSENFHYRNNNPVLCKKGLFSCFKPYPEKVKLDANPTDEIDIISAFENPSTPKSQTFIKTYVDKLKKYKKGKEAEKFLLDISIVEKFLKIKNALLYSPFVEENINHLKLYEKFIHESHYSTPNMIQNLEEFFKNYNSAKLNFISKNPERIFSDIDVKISEYDVKLQEKLGEGGYGTAYKAYIPFTDSIAVVKFPKHPIEEKLLQNEYNALSKTGRLKAWDDDLKISIQNYIKGSSLLQKIDTLTSMETLSAKIELSKIKTQYDNLAIDFAKKYGLNHGDIAPRNVIIDDNGKLHLIDFGMTTIIPQNTNLDIYLIFSKKMAHIEWTLATLRKEYEHALQTPTDINSIKIILKFRDLVKQQENSHI